MTEENAIRAAALLNEIRMAKAAINRLKNEREAKLTGLDHNAPGPKHHVLDTIDREWGIVGEWCVDFFITAMDTAIRNEELELSQLQKELEDL